ncbi:GDP-L-fucose synthase [Actinosynnema sp. NPDC020468]|uniref:GDP-L-fucose synthase family protein n=1 Tax=Actinosynnema sp. NPDC020468 TaxID=3154488 RepID=UPI0033C0BA1D
MAGAGGLAGSAISRALRRHSFTRLIEPRSSELDLLDRSAVTTFLHRTRPDAIVLAAARVGGIAANDAAPADFLSDNLRMQLNVMDAAREVGVRRLLFLGSSCAYPRDAAQPMRESALLSGPLEPTNDGYAIAKIAGVLQVQAVRRQDGRAWISAMPTNLYGPGDNFHARDSHVLPALVRRFHEAVAGGADTVALWGTGTPRREFLHADDLGEACVHLLRHYDAPEAINVGTGVETTIRELAELVAAVAGFRGDLAFDPTMPDGAPRKVLDVGLLHDLGWRARIPLERGVAETYRWFAEHREVARR